MISPVLVAAAGPLRWQPHPEVWFLLLAVVGLGFYVIRVIQPTMVLAGEEPVTRRQKRFFASGVFVLWLASDWPLHDLAEEYLFAAHMVQHLSLTLVMPPLLLLATPAWLIRLILGAGRTGKVLAALGRPLFAGLVYNALVAFTHAAPLVNTSVENGPVHYVVHATLVLSALLMWNPVCGPVPELRLSLPTQMVYLFGMSVLPTIPFAFLIVAENPLYRAYERGPYRLWGVNVIEDQQMAGLIMKLGGGSYLWAIILVLFFTWANRQQAAERSHRTPNAQLVLTYEQVAAQFEESPPPATEVNR